MNPLRLTIPEIQEKFKNQELKPSELMQNSLNAIKEKDGTINAIVRNRTESAMEEAQKCDEAFASGNADELGALAGIPLIVKDNMAIKGQEVTASSKILGGFRPPYNATAIAKIQSAGAIITAQANMDEFAMGSSCETSHYGPTRNPWNTDTVPGGSSGGSAAALAAGYAPISLGSDTGGSIRQPASFCGTVGLKPTYGRVSRYGLFAYGSSLDQIGPLANSVDDCATVLKAIEGLDSYDSTSVSAPIALSDKLESVEGLKIGVPKEFMDSSKGLRPEVKTLLEENLKALEKEGAEIREISLPILDYVIPTYYLIANCEASSNLARYDSIRYGYRSESPESLMDSYLKSREEGFGGEVKTRIMLGTYALSAGYYDAYYKKAELIRQDMRAQTEKLFEEVDIIAGPTAPDVAFKVGEKTDDPLSMYMQDIYTTFVNLISSPAMSVPCGLVDGLPVGMQMVGKLFDENTLFRTGKAIEKVRKWEPICDS
ncbi:MAG: Asp-tRNA(Asn)/Glu-tRNA(Gln) amidotransferase subunit GatA [Planctomycetes bacterium]|nr:Asp-tRNA(Asn)/Glu-tRNA(Gln) amidotransferase subunit GatA [Planctomycetota bacterium]